MRYWVIKASPKNLSSDSLIKVGEIDRWWGKIPKELQKGDKLFFWKSAPSKRIYALGELTQFLNPDKNNTYSCRVKFLTAAFEDQPTLEQVTPIFGSDVPSFLRRGPSGTFFPLSEEEANKLYDHIVRRNPALINVWNDIVPLTGRVETNLLDVDYSVIEGKPRLVSHLRRERDPKIIAKKKEQTLRTKGKLECEICSFDFTSVYGNKLGYSFCEVHHRLPLATKTKERKTTLADLAIVCSNCHRMIHRTDPMKSIEDFRKMKSIGEFRKRFKKSIINSDTLTVETRSDRR